MFFYKLLLSRSDCTNFNFEYLHTTSTITSQRDFHYKGPLTRAIFTVILGAIFSAKKIAPISR